MLRKYSRMSRVVNCGKVAVKAADSYKAVLIAGENLPIPADLRELYQQVGYLLIGDGSTNLKLLDYSVLKGKIDSTTRIYISAHGSVENRRHVIDMPTKELLQILTKYSQGKPLNIHLDACYSGAAAPDVKVLPVGSILFTHGPATESTCIDVGHKFLLESSRDLTVTDFVQDFIQRFTLNVKQMATVSINKKGKGIFKHVVRPPNQVLTTPSEIGRYFERQRLSFINAYNMNFAQSIDIRAVPKISNKEAIEWRNDNFIFSLTVGDKKLAQALETRIEAFSDYINYSLESAPAITYAIDDGSVRIVKAMLSSDKFDASVLNKKNEKGRTVLMSAAKQGYDGIVTVMLAYGKLDAYAINQKDNKGYTAFMLAAKKGQDDVVVAILSSDKFGADAINQKDKKGRTAFMLAAKKGQDDVVAAMLSSDKFNADVINQKNKQGRTAMMLAAMNGLDLVLSAMLAIDKIDANVINQKDDHGRTALMLAAMNGQADIVRAMLKSGKLDASAINQKDNQGRTALTIAAMNGQTEVVTAMLASVKFDENAINQKDKQGYTAFMLAAMEEQDDVVTAMLASAKFDANAISQKDHLGHTAFIWAAMTGKDAVVSAMLESDKFDTYAISMRENHGFTGFMLAAAHGFYGVVSKVLGSVQLNEDCLNAMDNQGRTAFVLAAIKGNDKVVYAMLSSGKLDITAANISDIYGNTALMWAAKLGQENVVAVMLPFDQIVLMANLSNYDNKTAVMLAADLGFDKIAHDITFAIYSLLPPILLQSILQSQFMSQNGALGAYDPSQLAMTGAFMPQYALPSEVGFVQTQEPEAFKQLLTVPTPRKRYARENDYESDDRGGKNQQLEGEQTRCYY